MNFVDIQIKNFRNFEDIKVNLKNKNIFFGMNDVGKTNFLYALRYVFDRNIRKYGFVETDFHNKRTEIPIEILVTIDISDESDVDCQKLRAKMKGALLSQHNTAFIKIKGIYNEQEMVALPMLFWGGDINKLYEIKQKGYFFDLDSIFDVIYIDSYVDVYALFKKHVNVLIKNDEENDRVLLNEINKTVFQLNQNISLLSGIKSFENQIIPEYKKFRDEEIQISIKSEIAVKGLFSNIVPYIKRENDDLLYPTSGEGRKKILAYSIFDLLARKNKNKKINLFLVEEPENHLHKSMQIALSTALFSDNMYSYLFVSTHSPFILYEMDNVNLVRIYNDKTITGASVFYQVPNEFNSYKKGLNRFLSEAIFSNKVLLVEGPSELTLFEKILSSVYPNYGVEGVYILPVNGVGFSIYRLILQKLHIMTIIKTDNDLKKVSTTSNQYVALGFSRCNKIIDKEILPKEYVQRKSIKQKRDLYKNYKVVLDGIREEYLIYLSQVDLENDLHMVLGEKLRQYVGNEPVKYLQKAKHQHMIELVNKLSDDDCKKIYEHYNFACLKRLVE